MMSYFLKKSLQRAAYVLDLADSMNVLTARSYIFTFIDCVIEIKLTTAKLKLRHHSELYLYRMVTHSVLSKSATLISINHFSRFRYFFQRSTGQQMWNVKLFQWVHHNYFNFISYSYTYRQIIRIHV